MTSDNYLIAGAVSYIAALFVMREFKANSGIGVFSSKLDYPGCRVAHFLHKGQLKMYFVTNDAPVFYFEKNNTGTFTCLDSS